MPKLLFEPKFHRIGDNQEFYCTSCRKDDPVIFIKCDEVGKFILEQMYPEHKSRKDIAPLVVERFGITLTEATDIIQDLVLKLLGERAESSNG